MVHLEIEATNHCNTRCLHCPHEAITRPLGTMTWETFQTLADKARDAVSFEFSGMGEPLLNPDIDRFIAYVSPRAQTSLTTNAALLTPANTKRLIDAGLNRLTISFNGPDKDTYEVMMGGLSFERAQTNVRKAVMLAKNTSMQIMANVSVAKSLGLKLAALKQFLSDVGIETVLFSMCHNRGGRLNDPTICTTPPPPLVSRRRCDIFTHTLFVAWNGDVLSCCHDLAGENHLGNLVTDTFETIQQQRRTIAARGVAFQICGGCNDMYRLGNDPTPDGSPLGDWIYQLYATEDPNTRGLTKRIATLAAQVETQRRDLAALQAELDAIHTSRSWHLLQRAQAARLRLVPRGSRREQVVRGWVRRIGV